VCAASRLFNTRGAHWRKPCQTTFSAISRPQQEPFRLSFPCSTLVTRPYEVIQETFQQERSPTRINPALACADAERERAG
jgi:hypothetical protein